MSYEFHIAEISPGKFAGKRFDDSFTAATSGQTEDTYPTIRADTAAAVLDALHALYGASGEVNNGRFEAVPSLDGNFTLFPTGTPSDVLIFFGSDGEPNSSGNNLLAPWPSRPRGLAFNPATQIDWESLPPQPTNIAFPEVAREDFLRAVRRGIAGLKISIRVVASGSDNLPSPPYATGVANTITGTTQIDVSYPIDQDSCGTRNCQVPRPAVLPNLPLPWRLVPYTAPTSATISQSHETDTETSPDGTTVSEYDFSCAVNPTLFAGFYRGVSDRTIHLYLLGAMGPVGDPCQVYLTCYAPVTGADFKAVYGLPDPPVIVPTSPPNPNEYTVHTIDGDGPTVFGVPTKLYGWYITYHYDAAAGDGVSSGDESYVPTSLDVTEILV